MGQRLGPRLKDTYIGMLQCLGRGENTELAETLGHILDFMQPVCTELFIIFLARIRVNVNKHACVNSLILKNSLSEP